LNSRAARFIGGPNKERFMLALYIIFGFIAVLAAINFIEFGRID
jgi:ribose/xylose/arabinose/galactoside ABC-type transport system permease subunit